MFEAPGVGAIEEELFYASVHLLRGRVFMGADECFELLPVCVGLEFEVCVGVDEKVAPAYWLTSSTDIWPRAPVESAASQRELEKK